nr:hypothetical protein [Tanacetum cinerariifolium]
MLKVDMEPIAPRLLNNRTIYFDYLRVTQEQAEILRKVVEQEKSQNPLNNSLDHADMMASSPICFLLNASKTKSWLWNRRLSHLKFGTINHLARQDLIRGLHTNQEKLYLLHIDLCGLMHVASVNGKKYILIIVNDYSRFTWVKFLRSKDEALDFIIKFVKMIQVRLKTPVCQIKTDNETEFVNQTLCEYYENVCIFHETSVARSPQQNGFIERQNRSLIEAARTMLIYAKALIFLWAEAVATPSMDSEHRSSGPALHEMTPITISSRLVPNSPLSTPFIPPSRTDWDLLFQPLFDELHTPQPSVDHPAPEVIAPIAEVVAPEPAASTSSPSSTIVDQDAPSPSNSQTSPKTQTLVISNDVEEDNHDLDVTHMNNGPFFVQADSTGSPSSTTVDQDTPSLKLTNFKQAITKLSGIDAMQKEIHEFERLQVKELVPYLDKVFLIKLNWIYKLKTDEFGRVLKNKERLRPSVVGNKMHKAFPLPGESSHCQYKFPLPVEGVPTAKRIEIPLPGVYTAMMKKLPAKCGQMDANKQFQIVCWDALATQPIEKPQKKKRKITPKIKSGVGNKMHKEFLLLGESSHWQYKFPLPVEGVPTARRMEIPLPGESSHWQYKFPLPVEGVPTARRMEIPLPRVCTAMKKLPVKENWQLH